MQLGLVLANKQDLAELLGCVRTRVRAARLNGEDFARALVAHLGSVSVARLRGRGGRKKKFHGGLEVDIRMALQHVLDAHFIVTMWPEPWRKLKLNHSARHRSGWGTYVLWG